jgi:hypothetical protein
LQNSFEGIGFEIFNMRVYIKGDVIKLYDKEEHNEISILRNKWKVFVKMLIMSYKTNREKSIVNHGIYLEKIKNNIEIRSFSNGPVKIPCEEKKFKAWLKMFIKLVEEEQGIDKENSILRKKRNK